MPAAAAARKRTRGRKRGGAVPVDPMADQPQAPMIPVAQLNEFAQIEAEAEAEAQPFNDEQLEQPAPEHMIYEVDNLEYSDDELQAEANEYYENVSEVHLEGTAVQNIDMLPDSVREIYLSGNYISHIGALPAGLKDLTLQYEPVKDIAYLPVGLESMWLARLELENLPEIPEGVHTIRLAEVGIAPEAVVTVPSSTTSLYMSEPYTLQIRGNGGPLQLYEFGVGEDRYESTADIPEKYAGMIEIVPRPDEAFVEEEGAEDGAEEGAEEAAAVEEAANNEPLPPIIVNVDDAELPAYEGGARRRRGAKTKARRKGRKANRTKRAGLKRAAGRRKTRSRRSTH